MELAKIVERFFISPRCLRDSEYGYATTADLNADAKSVASGMRKTKRESKQRLAKERKNRKPRIRGCTARFTVTSQ